ncbi:MAG: hypothetical protein LBN24_07095 [Mediterranea sp.]|jgi:hypothetical protein|nr:hypothetical protein [Mediterranea sp.]
MAQKKGNAGHKDHVYNIKVPVYTTEIVEGNCNDLFGGPTISDMLNYVKNKIKEYSLLPNSDKKRYANKNKTKLTVINDIKISEKIEGEDTYLLLKISAYTTNYHDGFIDTGERKDLTKDTKIGSDTNFVMLYPQIDGVNSTKYKRYFLVLVYEDPTKNNDDISKIAKTVMNQILNKPTANIKLPTILDEIKSKWKTIPELQIKCSGIYKCENDDNKYSEYYIGGQLNKQRTRSYEKLPVEQLEDLINEPENEYQKKEVKMISGKAEYKITKELINEAGEILKEAGEKIFNMTTSITQEELDNKVHDEDFVFSKLVPIVSNYLSYE